jgi:uncharacterized protein (TIGR02284 family)
MVYMSLTDTFKTTPQRTLKSLIQILHDGQLGFKKASENVKDTNLKSTFSNFSLQRAKFAGELESELLALGEEDPQKEGSTITGGLHRGWIDVKSALTGHTDHAVLSEAERGEDAAKKAYKDALETDLPANVREIVSAQAFEIQAAHDEVKRLRDATK